MSKTNIYVLKLSSGKYYVGKSNNCEERLTAHLEGDGSSWTRKYKPIGIEKIIKNVSPFEEDKITKEYMSKYGIQNVRGGTYVTEILTDSQEDHLKKEIWAAKDLCTNCGRAGHFVKDCYASTDILGNTINDEEEIVWCCELCDTEFNTERACDIHQQTCRKKQKQSSIGSCYRCGHKGHFERDCYARRTIDGDELENSDDSDYDDSDCSDDY